MEKAKINYFVDVLMGIAFISVVVTGVFKFPGLTKYFISIYQIITPLTMARIHDWSGVIMSLLVLIHLILHWKWIVVMTKNIFKRK